MQERVVGVPNTEVMPSCQDTGTAVARAYFRLGPREPAAQIVPRLFLKTLLYPLLPEALSTRSGNRVPVYQQVVMFETVLRPW